GGKRQASEVHVTRVKGSVAEICLVGGNAAALEGHSRYSTVCPRQRRCRDHGDAMCRLIATLATAALLYCVPAKAVSAPDVSVNQYTSGGHVLGFDSAGYYVSNGTFALRVSFDNARPVRASADDDARTSAAETQANPLTRVSYAGLWDGISVTY